MTDAITWTTADRPADDFACEVCLGPILHGQRIAWNEELDIGIHEECHDRVATEIEALKYQAALEDAAREAWEQEQGGSEWR